jgi:putative restriction endonuclease
MDEDLSIRMAAFQWLANQVELHGDVLSYSQIQRGFMYNNRRLAIVAPQGIFKPKELALPLSIKTTCDGPYEDKIENDTYLFYKYRGTDPYHQDNVGLREIFIQKRPLVYFHCVVPGKYMPIWPVFIIADNPSKLEFTVVLEDIASVYIETETTMQVSETVEARRAYLTSTVLVRLHQRKFRERVLDAYRSQCSMCRLKHRELLDAAHIVPDRIEAWGPTINNGLALCKLHHAAFDRLFIGVTPDYEIRDREDILIEDDGPMLEHGLQGLHMKKLVLPINQNDHPDREALEWRFDLFQAMR